MREIDFPKNTVVITDPPYGNGKYATDKAVPIEYYRWLVSSFKTVAIFGYPEKLVGICIGIGKQPDEWITWFPTNKTNAVSQKRMPKSSEAIAIFGETPRANRIFRRRTNSHKMLMSIHSQRSKGKNTDPLVAREDDVWRDPSPFMMFHAKKRRHPNQKPLSLMMKLVLLCSVEGDTIFDPFMGSGTTGEAVVVLGGRNFYGMEKDFSYFSIAEKVISNAREGSLRLLTHSAVGNAPVQKNLLQEDDNS
jgi:site-specific DNA-methyltransferase (adenine-specific)